MTRHNDLELLHGVTPKVRDNAVKQDRVHATNAIGHHPERPGFLCRTEFIGGTGSVPAAGKCRHAGSIAAWQPVCAEPLYPAIESVCLRTREGTRAALSEPGLCFWEGQSTQQGFAWRIVTSAERPSVSSGDPLRQSMCDDIDEQPRSRKHDQQDFVGHCFSTFAPCIENCPGSFTTLPDAPSGSGTEPRSPDGAEWYARMGP